MELPKPPPQEAFNDHIDRHIYGEHRTIHDDCAWCLHLYHHRDEDRDDDRDLYLCRLRDQLCLLAHWANWY